MSSSHIEKFLTTMIERLRDIVVDVSAAADNVPDGNEEFSTTAEQLQETIDFFKIGDGSEIGGTISACYRRKGERNRWVREQPKSGGKALIVHGSRQSGLKVDGAGSADGDRQPWPAAQNGARAKGIVLDLGRDGFGDDAMDD